MLRKPSSCEGCVLACAPHGSMQGFVPADGEGTAGVLMVLEAAGEQEVEAERVVVGRAGQYLFQQLARVGVEREMFRIHNVLSCRPPGNKLAGMPYEAAAINHCAPNLDATILDMGLRAARYGKTFTILTLGKTAFKRVMQLPGNAPILQEDYRCYPHYSERYQAWVVAADHPSFLMRGNHHITPVLQFAAQRALEIARDGIKLDQPVFLEDPPAAQFAQWVSDYIAAQEADPEGIHLAYDIETPYKSGADEDEVAREHDDDYTILRCSFAYREGEAVSVPWDVPYLPSLQRIFAHPGIKVGHNLNYDSPRVRAQMPIHGVEVDAMLAWHVLNSSLPKGLGFITPFYNPTAPMWKHLSDARPAFYNAADSYYTLQNYFGIKRDLKQNNLWHVFERHIIQLNKVISYMTEKGLLLDQEGRAKAEERLTTILAEVEGRMEAAVPAEARVLKVYKKTPKDTTGLELIAGMRKTAVCPNCFAEDVKAAHFKSIGKKRLDTCLACGKARKHHCDMDEPGLDHAAGCKRVHHEFRGESENPCFGLKSSKIEVKAALWAERLPFSLSNTSMQRYQSVVGHREVLSRKEKKVTFDVNALKILRQRYPDDKLYTVIDEFRRAQKLLTTYVGVTEQKTLYLSRNYTLQPGEELGPVPKKAPKGKPGWIPGEDKVVLRRVIRGGMPTDRNGLIHTNISHNPSTLRLASNAPNLQNLPRSGKPDDIKSIPRNLIIAHPGHTFGGNDFSGIEAVLVGYEARSPEYIRLAKRDVHSFYTAYGIAELQPGRISKNDLPLLSWDDNKLFTRLAEIKQEFKDDRNELFKHLLHGGNFGQGPKGMAEKILKETNMVHDIKRIARLLDIYRELFPSIPRWQREVQLQAERDGYLRNAFGYVHRFNRVFSWKMDLGKWVRCPGDDMEAVLAFRPQSNAAAIIKEATMRLYFNRFEAAGQYLRLLIHDEVFVEAPTELIGQVLAVLKEEMEKPIPELPLPAEWGMGTHLSILTEGKTGSPWGSMR